MTDGPAKAAPTAPGFATLLLRNPLAGVFVALIAIFVISALISPYFLSAYNMSVIARGLAFVGLVTIAQASLMILGIFSRLGVREAEGFAHLHGLIEATKQAFLVRDRVVGDPGTMSEDPRDFLADGVLERLARRIDPARALPWPAPEALVLKFIAHHLWDPARRAEDTAHGMPADVEASLRAGQAKAEAGDDLVEDQHDAVLRGHLAHRLEIARLGQDATGIAHDRFGQHGGDVVAFAPDRVLQRLRVVPRQDDEVVFHALRQEEPRRYLRNAF